MFALANVLGGVAKILHTLIFIYTWVVLIAAVITWVRPDPYNPIIRVLRALTEPVQWRVRKLLPFVYAGGIDFSPLVIILILQFMDFAVVQSLAELAMRMRAS